MIGAWIAGGALVLMHVDVVPIESPGTLADRAVVVRDGRIERIEPAAGFVAPDDARVVECGRAFLLPGLIDADVRVEDSGELAQHLLHGVTTVRVHPGRTALIDLRAAVASGAVLGPRMIVGSPWIDRGDELAIVELVGALRRSGYDELCLARKITAESARELDACATDAGLAVAGEISRALGRDAGLRGRATLEGVEFLMDPPPPPPDDGKPKIARPVMIERGMGQAFPRAEMRAVAQRTLASGVAIVPELGAFEALIPQIEHRKVMLEDPRFAWITPPFRLLWGFHGHGLRRFFPTSTIEPARACLEFQRELVAALHEVGVPIVAGSGAMRDFLWPGEALVGELEALCTAGLRADEALASATLVAARELGLEGGVVRVGAPADLVLVARDPREDVGRMRTIVGVVLDGRWHARAELEAARDAATATYAREDEDLQALIPKDIREGLARIVGRADGLLARPEAAQRLGELLVDVDRAKDAEYFGLACRERYPEAWWPHWVLARALNRLKDLDGAAAAAREALARRPDAIEPWMLLASLSRGQ